jgi:hypothetical protein
MQIDQMMCVFVLFRANIEVCVFASGVDVFCFVLLCFAKKALLETRNHTNVFVRESHPVLLLFLSVVRTLVCVAISKLFQSDKDFANTQDYCPFITPHINMLLLSKDVSAIPSTHHAQQRKLILIYFT